jgi:hypothetical protein
MLPVVCLLALFAAPEVRLQKDGTITATGLPATTLARLAKLAPDADAWSDVLSAHTGDASNPAMLGAYSVEKGVLKFKPRFPLRLGVRYLARLQPEKGAKPIVVPLALAGKRPAPSAVVVAVHPSASKLPENHLRFYIHFSAPMAQNRSYTHIKLLDAKGKAIPLPFLELDEELWDETGKRFTLYLDPGRIKKFLKPREELGPVLEQGKSYTLAIEKTWNDVDGVPMKASFRKAFTAGPPDEKQIDYKKWKLTAPTGRKPLRVEFGKAMDHALAHRDVWVEDAGGKKVAGKVALEEKESVWLFTPAAEWKAGTYNVVADTTFEDPSGNNLERAFEVDVFKKVDRTIKTKTVRIPFRVK